MKRLALILLMLVGCAKHTAGSAIYTPSVAPGTDVTAAGTVTGINGGTVPAGTALTQGYFLEAMGAGQYDAGPVNLANTNSVTGVLPAANQAAQTVGVDLQGTTAAAHVVQLSGDGGQNITFLDAGAQFQLGATVYGSFLPCSTGLGQAICFYGKETTPGSSNWTVQDVGGQAFLNGTTEIALGTNNGFRTIDVLASSVNITQPVQGGSGVPYANTISSVGLYDAAGGTAVLTAGQQQTPIINIGTVSLTGNATLELCTACPAGSIFDVDATKVTLNAHTLTIANGTGTFVISGTLGTSTTGPFTRCYTPTTATVVCE